MSEDRQDQDSGNGTTRRVPINLGLLHPIGTPQVTPVHALAPGAQSLGSLIIQPPRQDSLFPANDTGVQYLSQGPIGSPTVPVSQSIDPALMGVPGTGAHAAYQANLERAANTALSFGPGQFRAYHGTGASPFEQFLDEFIGTGEGAQAYSWGHYVAQKPGVAKSYVQGGIQSLTLHGQPWDYNQLARLGDQAPENVARDYLLDNKGDIDRTISSIRRDAQQLWARGQESDMENAAQFLESNRHGIQSVSQGGGLLNVWVKPDHEEFLDWDLAHHEQEPGVQGKLTALGDKIGADEWWPSGRTGQEIYKDLVRGNWNDAINVNMPGASIGDRAKFLASKQLDEAGIPGMRFLDQQSRHLPESRLIYTGKGTLPPDMASADFSMFSSPDELERFHQRDLDYWSQQLRQFGDTIHGQVQQHIDRANDSLEFLRDNRGDFQVQKNPRTYNYVVYDPKNIEITHRDGQRVYTLEPVDHDPWAEQKAVP